MTESSRGRAVPYRGMTYSDYSRILSDFGSYPVVMNIADDASFRDLCSCVESGFPVLASFQGHVITLVGHTIDYSKDVKVDVGGFVDSSQFLKQFIVIDDNFFPYQVLGYTTEEKENYAVRYPDNWTIDSIKTAVCPFPEKAFVPPDKARQRCRKYFDKAFSELALDRSNEPLVSRLFLATGTSFKRKKVKDAQDTADVLSMFASRANLPHFIWVMEVSPLSRYKQKKCYAEIVLDATAGKHEHALLYLRIGKSVVWDEFVKKEDDAPEYFAQYNHNLGEAE